MTHTTQPASSKAEQNEQINLTSEEIQMIAIQREKKALEEKENQLKAELERAKDIERTKKEMKSFSENWTKQNKAAKAYFELFEEISKGQYILNEIPKSKNFVLKFDTGKKQTDEESGPEERVYQEYFNQDVVYSEFKIEKKDSKFTIEVREHFVSTNKGWSRENRGFEMFMRDGNDKNHWFKQAKTVDKYIKEQIASYISKVNSENEKRDLKKRALNYAKAEFENNFDSIQLDTAGYYVGQRRNEWRTIDVIVMQKGEDRVQLTFSDNVDGEILFQIRDMRISSEKALTILRTF